MPDLTEDKLEDFMDIIKILNEESGKSIAVALPERDKDKKGKIKYTVLRIKKKKK